MELLIFSISLIAILVLYFFKPKIDKSQFKIQPQESQTPQQNTGGDLGGFDIGSPFAPSNDQGLTGGGLGGWQDNYTDINDL